MSDVNIRQMSSALSKDIDLAYTFTFTARMIVRACVDMCWTGTLVDFTQQLIVTKKKRDEIIPTLP